MKTRSDRRNGRSCLLQAGSKSHCSAVVVVVVVDTAVAVVLAAVPAVDALAVASVVAAD